MDWGVILFESKRGERFVEEFIKNQDFSTIAKIAHTIDLLEKHGSRLGMPHSKKISRNLYELRIRGKQEIRIIYGFVKSNIYLLHAFRKKTQKTPQKEIRTGRKRLDALT